MMPEKTREVDSGTQMRRPDEPDAAGLCYGLSKVSRSSIPASFVPSSLTTVSVVVLAVSVVCASLTFRFTVEKLFWSDFSVAVTVREVAVSSAATVRRPLALILVPFDLAPDNVHRMG